VLSVCYDSATRRTVDRGRLDLTSLGNQLAGAMLSAGVGQRPLVLVGHSLGGLMLQQVCLSVDGLANTSPDEAAKRRASAFIGNVLGAVFYSSPLAGSRLADWAVRWLTSPGPVMSALTTLSLEAHRVTEPFADLRKRERQDRPSSWATLGLCETNATSLGNVGVCVNCGCFCDGARAGAWQLGLGGRLTSAFCHLASCAGFAGLPHHCQPVAKPLSSLNTPDSRAAHTVQPACAQYST
jgi:hypothetical protein